MEWITDLSREAYERLFAYHPVTFSASNVIFTWEAFVIITFLVVVGAVSMWHKGKSDRAELSALRKLTCTRRRLAAELESLYANAFCDTLVVAKIKARHKDKLQKNLEKTHQKKPETQSTLEALMSKASSN